MNGFQVDAFQADAFQEGTTPVVLPSTQGLIAPWVLGKVGPIHTMHAYNGPIPADEIIAAMKQFNADLDEEWLMMALAEAA